MIFLQFVGCKTLKHVHADATVCFIRLFCYWLKKKYNNLMRLRINYLITVEVYIRYIDIIIVCLSCIISILSHNIIVYDCLVPRSTINKTTYFQKPSEYFIKNNFICHWFLCKRNNRCSDFTIMYFVYMYIHTRQEKYLDI